MIVSILNRHMISIFSYLNIKNRCPILIISLWCFAPLYLINIFFYRNYHMILSHTFSKVIISTNHFTVSIIFFIFCNFFFVIKYYSIVTSFIKVLNDFFLRGLSYRSKSISCTYFSTN